MPADLVPFPSTPSSLIEKLADLIEAEREQRGGEPPAVAYGCRTTERDVELVVRELDGHPADALLGFTAPADWTAFGVACDGTAYACPADDHPRGDRFARTDPVDRARVVHLVHRSGNTLTRVRAQSSDELLERRDPPPDGTADADNEPLPGRIDDTCRRVLGLPTPPPDATPHELWAVVWLDAVVAAAADSPVPLDTRSVGLLHPAFQLWALSGQAMPRWSSAVLARFGRALGNVTDWELLRSRCAEGDWGLGDVTPSAAAWMDAGMFCRATIGSFLTVEMYLELLTELLPARVFDDIRATLRLWDLPQSAA